MRTLSALHDVSVLFTRCFAPASLCLCQGHAITCYELIQVNAHTFVDMTVLQTPTWPDGDSGKVLLHFTADCSVDALWEDFFGSYPELQAKLHKQRNDTNCAESPWVSDRTQLPVQQFVWPAPPAGADPDTAAEGKVRKVRFDAAPSLASKAFNSEEVQKVLAHVPGSHYMVESEVYTNAMYGDQFYVMSRTTIVARGPEQCQLHLVYAVDFKPSLSRLMKPMVAKGVDGGIRGSFTTLKKLLQEQYKLTDLPDSAPPPELPGGQIQAPAAAAPTAAAPAAPAPVAPAAAAAVPPASPPLLGLADYIVYQELVASILRMSDPRMIAQGLAMCLTLLLVHVLINALRPITHACGVAAAAAGGRGPGLLGLVCWPFVSVLDIPDSVSEVIGAMLLVAVANKLLVLGAELVSAYISASSAAPLSTSTPQSAAAADVAAVANGIASPEVQQTELRSPAAVTQASPGKQTGVRSPRRGRRGKMHQAPGSPSTAESEAAPASPAAGGGGGGEGLNVMANLGNVMSGWGRNLLGGAAMDEGLKALISGSWTRGGSDTSKAAAAAPRDARNEQGPGSASVDGDSSSTVGRVGAHNRTTSFTAVMDPLGLHIIEDYAQMHHLSQVPEESRGTSPVLGVSTSAAATPKAGTTAAAAAGRPGSPSSPAAAAAERGGSSSSRGLPSPAGSPTSSRPPSPSKHMPRPSSRLGLVAAAEDAAVQQPLLTSEGEASEPAHSDEGSSSSKDEGGRSGTPRTPSSAAVASEAAPGSGSKPAGDSGSSSPSPERSRQTPWSTGKAVKFSKDQVQHSNSAIDKSSTSFSVGSTGRHNNSAEEPLGRRSASPMLSGAAGDNAPGSSSSNKSLSRRSSRGSVAVPPYEVPAAVDVGYVVPGEEDEDEVVVEVFEHERVQPFRGWGHTWPGHFLPSDKVGHWGDRSGTPGGQLSMLFDRVAPKLPVGWTWKDQEWTVDMTGCDVEGCDGDGWSYGMDFSWLTWPPAPQSGKPGIKSFVRRRRWIRTRERLPPEAYEAAVAAAAESADQAVPQVAQKVPSSPLPEQSSISSVSNGTLSTRRSTGGDGGLMAGLGSGLGGLVGGDGAAAAAATAAVASATAMMNRFMKAVTDGQSPVGSLGGGQPAAAQSASATPAAAAAAGGESIKAPGTAARAAAGTATGVGLASPKQVLTGSSTAAAAPAAVADAGAASGRDSSEDGSSSSSVDSDMEPPRPAIHQPAEEWMGPSVTSPLLNAGPPLEAAQSALVTPASEIDAEKSSSRSALHMQQSLEEPQQPQQSDLVQEVAEEVDRQQAAPSTDEMYSSVITAAAPAAGSNSASVLPGPGAAGASAPPSHSEVVTGGPVQQEVIQHGPAAATAPASTVASDAVGSAEDSGESTPLGPMAAVCSNNVPLETGPMPGAPSDQGPVPGASEAASDGSIPEPADAQAGPGMGDLSEITAGLPPVMPVTSLAADQQGIQTGRGQSSTEDWVWSTTDAGAGSIPVAAAPAVAASDGGDSCGDTPKAVSSAAPTAAASADASVSSAEHSSSSDNQPAASEPRQGDIREQSGAEAGSSTTAAAGVPPAEAATPPSAGMQQAGPSTHPVSQPAVPAAAAADPPAEPSSSSSSNAGLHVNPGTTGISGLGSSSSAATTPSSTVARSPRDGAVPRGRSINKRLNSSGGHGSRAGSSGRPKLGAVSLRQSEGGLRSAGGSGVVSPTAAAAAAAASAEWHKRSAADVNTTSAGATSTGGAATAATDSTAAAAHADPGRPAVDTANDMGSGLSWGEGSSGEADCRSQGPPGHQSL